jgi:outer membrane protein
MSADASKCRGLGRRSRLQTAAMLLVVGLIGAGSASALDPVYPFVDPLRSQPEILTTGVTLPGDPTPVPCPAYKDFAAPLALSEAVDLALCNNPQIKSSWANIKIQAGAVGEARAAYLPTVTGSLGRTNDQIRSSDSRVPQSNINQNTAQGSLTWRLLDFGGRAASHQAAENLLIAALASHNATLQKALAAVIQAYCDVLTTRAAVKAKTESVEIATSTLKSAKTRETKGLFPKPTLCRPPLPWPRPLWRKIAPGATMTKPFPYWGISWACAAILQSPCRKTRR